MNNPLRSSRGLRLACAVSLLLAEAAPAAAQMDDSLKFFEDEAMVITASRRAQAIMETPLAIDVVTAEEIAASGALNVWDLLRFRVGMDVLDGRSLDGNRAVVSARGFPHEFANNLLVLVDGRSNYNANTAGVHWEQIPVQLQDIDRIEIVRGPNAALYGTGAGVGVLNIITKRPRGKNVAEIDVREGNRGMTQAFQALETSIAKAPVRISHTFREQDGFPAAANDGVEGNDYLRKNVLNVRSALALRQRTELELFGGGSWTTTGIAPSTGRSDSERDFQMFKFSHRINDDSALEVSGTRSDSRTNGVRELQYDAEALHRITWNEKRLSSTYGASYRNVEATARSLYGNFRPRLEIYRGYLHQTYRPIHEFSLQGAVSMEGTTTSGLNPNYQLASVYSPSPRHAIRMSYSVAHTLRDFVPIYGDVRIPGVRYHGDPQNNTKPYKIASYEAGYHGAYLDDSLQADISLYYTKIKDHHAAILESVTFPPLLVTVQIRIYDESIARGWETKLKYRFSPDHWIYANYTYENITDTAGDGGFITENTPSHKLNFGAVTNPLKGVSLSADLGYKDKYRITSATGGGPLAAPAYWRLDAKLGWSPARFQNAEIYAAGQNLLKKTHKEFPDTVAVPRTIFGGISIKFGSSGK